MQEDLPEYLTVEEIATKLRVKVYTVREWIRKGELVAYKVGRDYRIYRALARYFTIAGLNRHPCTTV